jgi:8-oxo-dGTP diphosphatase
VRDWVVGGALIVSDEGLLLVQNRRRNGSHDWTPPGGVIDEGESLIEGLTREVEEETGLRVTEWEGPVYRVDAEAVDAGWHMHVEVHRAVAYEGTIAIDDPDGIVEEARFVPIDECDAVLRSSWLLLTEPINAWIAERHVDLREYRYRVNGTARAEMIVTRL